MGNSKTKLEEKKLELENLIVMNNVDNFGTKVLVVFCLAIMVYDSHLLTPPQNYVGLVKGFKLILSIIVFSLNFSLNFFGWYIILDVW